MKAEPEFLSLPKLLHAAQEAGLDVNERTLLYYVSRGLLPKGQRSPYNGADGRVAYWPATVVKRLRRILQLKDQGYKLEQIRRTLDSGKAAAPADPGTPDWRREVALRYLKNFLLGDYRPAREQLETNLPAPEADDAEWLQAFREYKIACLTPLIGAEPAAHWVRQYLLQIHPKELGRALTRFRQELAQRQTLSAASVAELSRTLRRVISDRLLGRVDGQASDRYVRSLSRVLQKTRRRLLELDVPVAPMALRAVDDALAALEALKGEESGYRQALQRYGLALERLRVCSETAAQWSWLTQFEPSS